jgi:hypothetical protein
MSVAKRTILVCYCLGLLMAFVIVPWKNSIGSGKIEVFLGYAPLWSAPKPPSKFENLSPDEPRPPGYIRPDWYPSATIDGSRIVLEIGALSALCGIGLLATLQKKS